MPRPFDAGTVTRIRRLRSLYRSLDPVRVDAVFAAVLLFAGVLAALLGEDKARGAQLISMVGVTVPVAFRRRRPIAAALTMALALLLATALGGAPTQATGIVALIALVSGAYMLGARTQGRVLAAGTIALIVALAVDAIVEESQTVSALLFFTFFVVGLPVAAGQATRSRAQLADELADRAVALERAREGEAQAAVQEERARIARELHDVVAHDVSVMVVQAAAAKRIVEREPDRAEEAIVSIEGTGREALAEMRRLLGVLRRGDEDLALAPQPSLSRVDALLARTRAAGLDVALERSGDDTPLPAGVDLAAYRVVQEALANVVRHAGAEHATVRLTYDPRAVVVEVVDDGRGAANGGSKAGHGLIGLRERVELYGGDFEAGPRAEGGFGVRARLPVAGVAA
jgi:signal transduction histidine kinase